MTYFYAQLADKAIQEFRAIWKKEFGEEISEDFARIRAAEVFKVLRLVLEKLVENPVRDMKDNSSEILEKIRSSQSIIEIE